MPVALTLAELATRIGAEIFGDADAKVSAVATLEDAQAGQISFLAHPRYRKYLDATQATAVILTNADRNSCPVSSLVVSNPAYAYAQAAELLHPPVMAAAGIHPSACINADCHIDASVSVAAHCVIEAGARIGVGVSIGAGCYIGENVSIGAHSRIMPNVTLCQDSVIGARAVIHPGAVIGSDGFGLASEQGKWLKVPQLGRVRIGNDVEIGANTTIDRGALNDTVIEDGVKLDNQIQVAHNVHIGAHTAIAGCVGIAGSARIGRGCTIGGGVGIAGHLEIVDDVHLTGMTLVSQSILEPGVYSSGLPAQPNHLWNKSFARLCQIDDMARRIKALEKKLQEDAK